MEVVYIKKVYVVVALLTLAVFAVGCVQQSESEVKEVSTPITTPEQEEVQTGNEEEHSEAVVVEGGEPSVSVNLKNFQFEPSNIEIEKGQIIEFRNVQGSHTVTISETGHDEPLVDVVLSGDQVVLVKFNEAGSFDLVCRFHENTGMTGKIIVI